MRGAATGATFSQFEDRGVTDTGRLLATIDDEMRKNGPVPKGCGENPAILDGRPAGATGFRRVWTDFRSQRGHPYMSIHPQGNLLPLSRVH